MHTYKLPILTILPTKKWFWKKVSILHLHHTILQLCHQEFVTLGAMSKQHTIVKLCSSRIIDSICTSLLFRSYISVIHLWKMLHYFSFKSTYFHICDIIKTQIFNMNRLELKILPPVNNFRVNFGGLSFVSLTSMMTVWVGFESKTK